VYFLTYDVMELTFTSEFCDWFLYHITLITYDYPVCCRLKWKYSRNSCTFSFSLFAFGIVIQRWFIGLVSSSVTRLGWSYNVCLCLQSVEVKIPIEKMKHMQGTGAYTLTRIFTLICNNISHILIFGFPERILLLASF
jgi:hypothetical protein